MWKIHDEKVKVYQAPDFSAPMVVELLAGDKVEILKTAKGAGTAWVLLKLPDGRKGYAEERVRVEDIGDGTRICPECGHSNSTDTWTCSECKRNFHPVLFHIPQTEKKKGNAGQWEGKGSISVPHACSSCCSTVNLQEALIAGGHSMTSRGTTTSTKFSSSVSFTAYLCPECRQIQAAIQKYRQDNDRVISIFGFALVASVMLLATFVIGLVLLIVALTQGGPVGLAASVSLISILLFLGSSRVYRSTRDDLAKKKASRDKEHLRLIESYGHPYQPVLIEYKIDPPDWVLKIFNRDYAVLFEKMNTDFEKIDN